MNLNAIIAANLKRLRQERNLSLGQLAELSDVSKVMLSQIEKGDSNPTINMIWKIANGLKVPYTTLIDQREEEAETIEKSKRQLQTDLEGHYRIYTYYNNSPTRNFEMFIIELDPGTEHRAVGHSERATEYLLVLEGSLVLQTQDKTYTLNPEDAICFQSSTEHTYKNNSTQLLKAMIINYYAL